MKCPTCGAPCALILFVGVECYNPRCRHYVEVPAQKRVRSLDDDLNGEPAYDLACFILDNPAPRED